MKKRNDIFSKYECEGQMDFYDCRKANDMTYDRRNKGHRAPSWMPYERCENCKRWAKYPTDEQPPDGWGCIGWCAEHNHKTKAIGWCSMYDDVFKGTEWKQE